jgi:CysZ protein
MPHNFILGFSYIFSGISLISKKGIRRFVLMPLLINSIAFFIAIKVITQQFSILMEHFLGGISWLPDWLEAGLEWLLYPLFAILIIIIVYYSFTMIANLIAAPFNAILAQKVEAKLLGKEIEVQDIPILQVIKRTLSSEVRKMAYMLKWFVMLLILTFIPVVNGVAPFAWMVYGAWMLALEYADYPMGNHELYFKEELSRLKKNKFKSLGFGSAIMLMTTIPIVNFFAMPVGVAAGTVYWVKRLKQSGESN